MHSVDTGAEIRKFGTRGTELGMFHRPIDVAYHPTRGTMLVADCMNKRLQEVTADGRPLRSIETSCYVVGVACNGPLVAASMHDYRDGDGGSNRVMLFKYDCGTLLRYIGSWGEHAGLLRYCGALQFTADGQQLVVASGFSESWWLSQWTVDGVFVKEAGMGQLGFVSHVGITCHGNWVACDGRADVVVFSGADGKLLYKLGGSSLGQLTRPFAAVCAAGGELWVGDSGRVRVFSQHAAR